MSPDLMLSSFKREVIYKKADIFKSAILKDISNVFSSDPFYAGFGNRDTDATACRMAGIKLNNIFLINEESQV